MRPSTRNRRPAEGSLLALLCLAALSAAACDHENLVEPGAPGASRADVADLFASRNHLQPLPFRGELTTTRQVIDPTPPAGCEQFANTVLEGRLTHVGRFVGAGMTCAFNAQFGVISPPVNPAGGPPPFFVVDFTTEQEYTAPNGDILRIAGSGVRVQSMTDGTSGLVGDGSVEGGTGRFEGATGEFDVLGLNGLIRYDGWMAYDASNVRD